MPKNKGKVVEASMSTAGGGKLGGGLSGKAIEEAMNQAVVDALAEGIVDPKEILKLKLAAREKVKADHRAAVARAEKKGK